MYIKKTGKSYSFFREGGMEVTHDIGKLALGGLVKKKMTKLKELADGGFAEAFAKNRAAGLKEFEWNGQKYNTDLAEEAVNKQQPQWILPDKPNYQGAQQSQQQNQQMPNQQQGNTAAILQNIQSPKQSQQVVSSDKSFYPNLLNKLIGHSEVQQTKGAKLGSNKFSTDSDTHEGTSLSELVDFFTKYPAIEAFFNKLGSNAASSLGIKSDEKHLFNNDSKILNHSLGKNPLVPIFDKGGVLGNKTSRNPSVTEDYHPTIQFGGAPVGTLYEYFTSKGQPMPSMAELSKVASQLGISGYHGSAEQNTAILKALTSQQQSNPQQTSGNNVTIEGGSKDEVQVNDKLTQFKGVQGTGVSGLPKQDYSSMLPKHYKILSPNGNGYQHYLVNNGEVYRNEGGVKKQLKGKDSNEFFRALKTGQAEVIDAPTTTFNPFLSDDGSDGTPVKQSQQNPMATSYTGFGVPKTTGSTTKAFRIANPEGGEDLIYTLEGNKVYEHNKNSRKALSDSHKALFFKAIQAGEAKVIGGEEEGKVNKFMPTMEKAYGGFIHPALKLLANGGEAQPNLPDENAQQLSSDSHQVINAGTHESGQDVPVMDENGQPQAMVENGEVMKGDQVYSARSGHADLIKPIEEAKGLAEKGLESIVKNVLRSTQFNRVEKAGVERQLTPLRQIIPLLDQAGQLIFKQQEEEKVAKQVAQQQMQQGQGQGQAQPQQQGQMTQPPQQPMQQQGQMPMGAYGGVVSHADRNINWQDMFRQLVKLKKFDVGGDVTESDVKNHLTSLGVLNPQLTMDNFQDPNVNKTEPSLKMSFLNQNPDILTVSQKPNLGQQLNTTIDSNKGGKPDLSKVFNKENGTKALDFLQTYGSDIYNAYLASHRPGVPTPLTQGVQQLNTTFDINPQLAAINASEKSYNKSVDDNTASSSTALARKNAARSADINARNELYGQKANAENQLKNQNTLNTQQVNAGNINTANAYNQQVYGEKLQKQSDMSSIVGNVANKGLLADKEQRQEANDQEKVMINAIGQAGDTGTIAQLMNTPTYQKMLKENAYARKSVRDMLKRSGRADALKALNEQFGSDGDDGTVQQQSNTQSNTTGLNQLFTPNFSIMPPMNLKIN